ncbi:MAG: 4-hydroxyphenylacetate 3-hydroxylase, partial [Thermoplasmata archaeon]|nr:4-hydroxyphenylacetate 3-hydroxylase [Thermoplasmata archaeon]
MTMKTPEEYKQSLKEMRPNIYKFGELIEDVTTHPATKRAIEGHAQIFALQNEEKYKEMLTTTSSLTGETISRYLSIVKNAEDMVANLKLKRLMYQKTGTCTGGRCVGWTSINAMFMATYDMDKEFGTDYHERLKTWLIDAQKRDITLAGALTDPKGDRTKPPHAQDDPDMNLRIVEKRENGIVVRGAKVQIAGTAAANEVFVLPGTGYKEADAHYAVSFVVPRDIEGLTVVEARHPSDRRDFEDGADNPVKIGGITQGYLLFEDVFVPNERVFMAGEYKYSLSAVLNFIMAYRSAIGACVAGQGDVIAGASALMARANGISEKKFSDKLVRMAINNETTYSVGLAAGVQGKQHPSGGWLCDPLLANVNKVHVATLPYETKRLAQDIGGGIAETGCMPSWEDLNNSEYGHLLKKYLKANSSAETRVKLARLIEWLTLGSGVPGCMHGGG